MPGKDRRDEGIAGTGMSFPVDQSRHNRLKALVASLYQEYNDGRRNHGLKNETGEQHRSNVKNANWFVTVARRDRKGRNESLAANDELRNQLMISLTYGTGRN
jgi:hypothetical protein